MTDHHQVIHDAIAALRVAADKARQSEPDHPRWEGEYDLLTHHAEMLEGVLANAGGALAVTDAMVERAWEVWLDHQPIGSPQDVEEVLRHTLTAALPLAKTKAEVRADERERLARLVGDTDEFFAAWIVRDRKPVNGMDPSPPVNVRASDWLRSQADGGE